MIEFLGWTVLISVGLLLWFWLGEFLVCLAQEKETKISFKSAMEHDLVLLHLFLISIWPVSFFVVLFCERIESIFHPFSLWLQFAEKCAKSVCDLFSKGKKSDESQS